MNIIFNKTLCKKSKKFVADRYCFIEGNEYLYQYEDYSKLANIGSVGNTQFLELKMVKVYSLLENKLLYVCHENVFNEHFYSKTEIRKLKLEKLNE